MINVNGHKLNLITDENKVIIYDLDNILTKQESLGIMLYLEEEGFLEEYFHTEKDPIKVEIIRVLKE